MEQVPLLGGGKLYEDMRMVLSNVDCDGTCDHQDRDEIGFDLVPLCSLPLQFSMASPLSDWVQ